MPFLAGPSEDVLLRGACGAGRRVGVALPQAARAGFGQLRQLCGAVVRGRPVAGRALFEVARQLLDSMLALLGRSAPPPATEPPLLDEGVLAGLEEALGSDLQTLIGFFCSNLPGQIAGLQSALAEGDHDEIRRQAHRLKGSAGNLGALALATLAREIEQQAQQQQALDAALGERLGDLAERTLERLHRRYPLPA